MLRHDFAARDLPGHGSRRWRATSASPRPTASTSPGARVYEVFARSRARAALRGDDVHEAAGAVARLLGGAPSRWPRMAPRRYERLADAGPATGVLDPLLVRAYLRAGAALPAHEPGDGTRAQRRGAAPVRHRRGASAW